MSFYGYSNWVEIYIKTSDGTPYSLQNLARGNYSGSSLRSPEYVQFVDSVSVNVSLFRFTQISISLSPTFEEAKNLIQSGLLGLAFGGRNSSGSGTTQGELASSAASKILPNQISVRLHSDTKSSAWFRGFLMVPEFSVNQEQMSIQMNAVGLLNFTRQRGTNKSVPGTQTYEQVLKDLTEDRAGANLRVEIDKNDALAVQFFAKNFNGNIAKKDWEAVKDILNQGNMNMVDVGADDVSGTNIIRIYSKDYARKKLSKLTLVAFKQIDPAKSMYPILDMKTSLVNYAAGQTLKSVANVVNDSTKTQEKPDEQSELGAKNAKEFTDGVVSPNGSLPGGAGMDGSSGRRFSAPMSRSEGGATTGNQYLDSLRGYWQSLIDQAMTYEITTIGIPDALPGEPVNVNIGDTEFLTGTYDCYEVIHNWSANGAETQFKLHQTFGLASRIDEGLEKVEAKVDSPSDQQTLNKTSTTIPSGQ